MQNGSDVRTFEYNIVEFNKAGYPVDTYTETYVFNPKHDILFLLIIVRSLSGSWKKNRELITDKKIFGGEN